jgi:hypothetical protein
MSAPVTQATGWQWPAEVLTFAAEQGVQAYLDPLREALYHVLQSLRITVEDDPEIRDDRHIVFEVRVPERDIPDFIQAVHAFTDEKYRICPAPLVCVFRLFLVPIS